MPLTHYPEHEFAPRGLSVEEINDPILVLEAFFDFAHLPQHRVEIREMLAITVAGLFNTLSTDRRSDVVYLIALYEKLVEACHVIYSGYKAAKNEKTIPH